MNPLHFNRLRSVRTRFLVRDWRAVWYCCPWPWPWPWGL